MASLLIVFSAALLLWRSTACMEAALAAATVFAQSVLPALLPLMVLAEWSALHASAKRSCFARAQSVLPLLLFALAAGSPAGARRIVAAQSTLTARSERFLLVAGGVMSPMFFAGTLALWLGNRQAALCMLASHWMSALLTGLLASRLLKPRPTPMIEAPPCDDTHRSALEALAPAIAAASRSLVAVCGAMMLYAVVGALLTELPLFRSAPPQAAAVLRALLEIGGGSHAVVACVGEPYALLCGLCSFGGLSLWTQNLAFVSKRIRPATLLAYRAVHGALAYAICDVMIHACRNVGWLVTFNPSVAHPAAQTGSPLPACLALLGLAAASWRRSRTCSPRS